MSDTLTVRRMAFNANVTFEAYVIVDEHGNVDTRRVAAQVADAIEYRAPNLSDSEEGDALVALVGGGSGFAAEVEVYITEVVEEAPTHAEVQSAIEGTEAWL